MDRVPEDLRRFHERYASVQPDDVPFAQDAVGDQWLLRDGHVISLAAETGAVEPVGQTFGGRLAPGQLLNVHPPFCTKESADGVDLSPVPATERLELLADLSRQMPPDGPFRISFD